MLINVDFDGVIIPNTYENLLIYKLKNHNFSRDDTSEIWDWYEQLVRIPLPLNIPLLTTLNKYKERGHHIRLWTNRSYTLKKHTLNNLKEYKTIFDSFNFYDGRKQKYKIEGVVVDNLTANLKCGEIGILYKRRW